MTRPAFDALVEALEASAGLPVPSSQEFAQRVVEQLDARGFEISGQRPTCVCLGTGWPHVPSSERCTPPQECDAETWSWKHFSPEAVDGYNIRCTLTGPHDEHADTGHTGLTWQDEEPDTSASTACSDEWQPQHDAGSRPEDCRTCSEGRPGTAPKQGGQ